MWNDITLDQALELLRDNKKFAYVGVNGCSFEVENKVAIATLVREIANSKTYARKLLLSASVENLYLMIRRNDQ
jgi:hypothetical protein